MTFGAPSEAASITGPYPDLQRAARHSLTFGAIVQVVGLIAGLLVAAVSKGALGLVAGGLIAVLVACSHVPDGRTRREAAPPAPGEEAPGTPPAPTTGVLFGPVTATSPPPP